MPTGRPHGLAGRADGQRRDAAEPVPIRHIGRAPDRSDQRVSTSSCHRDRPEVDRRADRRPGRSGQGRLRAASRAGATSAAGSHRGPRADPVGSCIRRTALQIRRPKISRSAGESASVTAESAPEGYQMGRWARLALTMTVLAAVVVVVVTHDRRLGAAGTGRCDGRTRGHPVVDCDGRQHPIATPGMSSRRSASSTTCPAMCCRSGLSCGFRPTPGDRPIGPRRADGENPSPTRRRGLHARSEQSTVNPYIWYLHGCKISTGCATPGG